LRVADEAGKQIRGGEASEPVDVVAHHGVVVAGFGVAGIGGEEKLFAAGIVPGFSKRKVAKLRDRVAAGIRDHAV